MIKQLQLKRTELLKIENKSKKDKIEWNLVSKYIRNKMEQKMLKEEFEIMKTTKEGNKNIKKMKKQLRLDGLCTL